MRSTLAAVAMTMFVVASLALPSAQRASGAPSLITAAELRAHMKEPALVLLHVGTPEDYAKAHVPGARQIDARTLAAPAGDDGGLTLQLPTPADLESRLEALGISDTSPVVVYAATSNPSAATRVVFTLDYAGLGGRTRLLDGGLAAWTAAGGPVTTEVAPPATVGQLTLTPRADAVASLGWVREHTKTDALVIDARHTQFYTGESDNGGRIPRPGHVPGAKSLPFDSFVRADGTFKPRAELEEMLEAAGARPGRPIATYCHVGQQATVPYFVARILGHDVKVFDGSYEEWSRASELPVSTGREP